MTPSWTLLSVLTAGPQAVAVLRAAVVALLACSNQCQLHLKVPTACWDHCLGAPADDRQARIGINRLQLQSTCWTVPNSHDSPSSLTGGSPAWEQQASSQESSTWCAAVANTVISKGRPLDDAQRRHAPCQAQGSSCACIQQYTHQTTSLIPKRHLKHTHLGCQEQNSSSHSGAGSWGLAGKHCIEVAVSIFGLARLAIRGAHVDQGQRSFLSSGSLVHTPGHAWRLTN